MNLLVVTNLFPSSQEPGRGVFNKQQFIELSKASLCRIIAPLPAHYPVAVPEKEDVSELGVFHPRYFMFPKLGRVCNGYFYYRAIRPVAQEISRDFPFQVILATWAFPDAYGAALLARELKKPLVIKVHGSDINHAAKAFFRRKLIVRALRQANAVIAVSSPLKQKLIELGIPGEKVFLLPNGVDAELFKVREEGQCRKELSLDAGSKIILYVGNIIKSKGVVVLFDAFSAAAKKEHKLQLVYVGDGVEKAVLIKKAKENGLSQRIIFAGRQPHEKIPLYMNACDVFCLPSFNEGCPNVVLEALACGKPVVASRVGGVPDLVETGKQGILVGPGDVQELADALEQVFYLPLDKPALRAKAVSSSWAENARQLQRILEGAVK